MYPPEYIVFKKTSEVRSDVCKDAGVRGEQILIYILSISDCGREVCISAWSSDRVVKGIRSSWRNFRVTWSYLNGGSKVLGGLLNNLSLYSSMLRSFFNGDWQFEHEIDSNSGY